MNSAPTGSEHTAGRLVVICGCMFAGKTTRLIELLRTAAAAGRRVLAVKHADDTRYDPTRLATHDGRSFAARPLRDAGEILTLAANCDVVGVDEAHFFGRGLTAVCVELVRLGRDVVVVGLEHDAWGRPFPPLPDLVARAADVEVCTAPCTVCGRPARFTQRMVPVTSLTMVGGPGEYEPRCERCFVSLPPPAPDY